MGFISAWKGFHDQFAAGNDKGQPRTPTIDHVFLVQTLPFLPPEIDVQSPTISTISDADGFEFHSFQSQVIKMRCKRTAKRGRELSVAAHARPGRMRC